MAILNIRTDNDPMLRQKCRNVLTIDKKIITLLDDMAETMYDADGIGLAAPQIGVLKNIVIVDIGDGLIELINPVIINSEGVYNSKEGCLSLPNVCIKIKRPKFVVVEALNRDGNKISIEGTKLLACALSHEIDHLNGVLITDKSSN